MSIFFGPIENITFEDILSFSETKTREGLTLDYKADFPKDLEKTISAFANTLGGAIIIGVQDDDGFPRLPVNGIDHVRGLQERIESIVLDNIYPPFIPQVQVCPPKDGKTFVVIRVDQSSIGPHAIHGRTGIYVRTGSMANPDDRATTDQVEWLQDRRRKSGELKLLLEQASTDRFENLSLLNHKKIDHGQATITLVPCYPLHIFCPAREIPSKLAECSTSFYGIEGFNLHSWQKPVQGGVYRFHTDPTWYTEVNEFGLIWHRQALAFVPTFEPPSTGTVFPIVLVKDLIQLLDVFLEFSGKLATSLRFIGDFELKINLSKLDKVHIKSGFRGGTVWEMQEPTPAVDSGVAWVRRVSAQELVSARATMVATLGTDFGWSLGYSEISEDVVRRFLTDKGRG